MITDTYNSLGESRFAREEYLKELITTCFHGMNKDARNSAHDEFVAILNMEIERNNNLTAAEVNSDKNYGTTVISACNMILTYHKGKMPLSNELFALLFNQVHHRLTGSLTGTSSYIIDYFSSGDIIRLARMISAEQLKDYKIFIVRHRPNKIDATIELLYQAFKDEYDYDRNSFYANLPEEYELGVFV